MTGEIMAEWLRWFDGRVAGRNVLLIMDNFSAHEVGLAKLGGSIALRHTRIIWLPPNVTNLYQPLDQGIIQNWKCFYRSAFLHFSMVE